MSQVILVVDDDRSVRASTVRLLITRGYTAIEATTALEAVTRATETSPDAILMDLHMHPDSGVEAARQIKARQVLADIPIIALSATPPVADEALQLFHAVLMKPCPSDAIIAAVETAMRG